MKKLIVSLFGFVAIASMVSPLPAAEPTTAPATQPADFTENYPHATIELLEHVQTQLRTIERLQAEFSQQKKMAMLKHTLTIEGRFALEKPNRLIWVVEKPVHYAIRIEGEEVRQWDSDTNNVQVIHLGGDPTFKAISDQIQSWFLGDYKTLGGSYDVFVITNEPLSLRFAPKSGSMIYKLIKGIDVTFAKDDLNIDKMIVHESSGDNTTMQFTNTRLNQPIAASTWEIPPK